MYNNDNNTKTNNSNNSVRSTSKQARGKQKT